MNGENDVLEGDCVAVMAGLDAESVDAIVTDPPYDLLTTSRNGSRRINNPDNPYGRHGEAKAAKGFMGKTWDGTGVAFRPETWAEALRVAKPGAHLLAFGGTRTYHRLACAIEDAGWEIRDCLVWAYASGFPKSLNFPDGWGTALKPAWEPIVMARKPLRGTVAANRELHGTGALNIDGTRIGYVSEDERAEVNARTGPNSRMRPQVGGGVTGSLTSLGERHVDDVTNERGRWPANVILTDPIFDGDTEGVVGGGDAGGSAPASGPTWSGESGSASRQRMAGMGDREPQFYGDSGTYSRFFLVPKAARSDREPVLGGLPVQRQAPTMGDWPNDVAAKSGGLNRQNVHPTVKPTELMRHLVRLVTLPGGLVLDPFLGSGTTALAAEMEGFRWLGIEKEPEYVAIARARLLGTQRGLGLSA